MNISPSRSAAWPAAVAGAVLAALFVADSAAALVYSRLPFDLAIERAVQAFSWGPLAAVMEALNWVADLRQAVVAVGGIAVVALAGGRAALTLVIGLPASGIHALLKPIVHRSRPPADLVGVREHESGFAYPSGHATFYTWFCVLLLVALTPWLPRRLRPAAWAVAAAVILLACIARVWAGAHWPSDVAGGFLLGAAWTLLVALPLARRWRAA